MKSDNLSENVWFSGDLSLENCNNVIENIFLSNDENAIPNILILDNTLRICGQMSGYDNSTLVNLIVELDTIFGDVNQDGLTNLLDVQPFISVLSTGTYQIEADCNQDGVVNLLDIAFFVDILSS
jgi:hypothetical protein